MEKRGHNEYNERAKREFEQRLQGIAALITEGVPKVTIAKNLGISRARLYQLIDQAKQRGIIK